jgi:hypothetical protein
MTSTTQDADKKGGDRCLQLANQLVAKIESSAKRGYICSTAEIKNLIEEDLEIPERIPSKGTGKDHPNPEFQLIMSIAKMIARDKDVQWGRSRDPRWAGVGIQIKRKDARDPTSARKHHS